MRPHPAAYRDVIHRALSRIAEGPPERLEPNELAAVCEELVRRAPAQQRIFARNSARAGRPEVCLELVRRAEAVRYSDPRDMQRWAHAAVAVADSLAAGPVPGSFLEDLRAESWACLSNAFRIAGDTRKAEHAWRAAERHRAAGSSDPVLEAEMLLRRGALRRRQGRLEEAISDLGSAVALFQQVGEGERAGRAAISLGIAYEKAGDLEAAIRSTVEGGRLVGGSRDPGLLLSALHNLATYLTESGHAEHAVRLLERLRDLHEQAGEDLNLLRLRWLEGKIAAGLGKQVEARAALNAVRREFLSRGMLYDAALVALELAALYAEAGWTLEVEKLAEEMYPVFISRDLPREASASLLLFVDAVNRRAATAEWIRKLAADLSTQRERKG